MEVRGAVAVVTGASSGLGRAVARLLAAEGARVVVTARREERLRELVAEIEAAGGQALAVAGDAGADGTADACVRAAEERWGRVDVLVHAAGVGRYKALLETSPADYDEMMHANMRSTFLMARAVAPGMVARRKGVMVLVSSVAGLRGPAGEAVYASTKFAQVGFAESLSEELRGWGVKVCALCPGGIKTEFAVGHGRAAEDVARSPMMAAEEVAEAVLFAVRAPAGVRVTQMVVRHMGVPAE